MCVIVGFTSKSVSREQVLACLDRACTRGPDLARTEETPLRLAGLPPPVHHGAG